MYLLINVGPFQVVSFGLYMSKPSDWNTIWSILWSVLLETWEACPAVYLNHGYIMIFFTLIPLWGLEKERNYIVLNLANKAMCGVLCYSTLGLAATLHMMLSTIYYFLPHPNIPFRIMCSYIKKLISFQCLICNWFINLYLGLRI